MNRRKEGLAEPSEPSYHRPDTPPAIAINPPRGTAPQAAFISALADIVEAACVRSSSTKAQAA